MKRGIIALICSIGLMLGTTACGMFGSSDGASPTTLLGEGVGAELETPSTTAPPATAAPAATTAAPAKCPYSEPVSEIEYGGRLRLQLTVSALCPSRAADIALTLKVTNISNAVVRYDKNQAQFFSLLAHPTGSGRIRWEDTNCQPPSRDRKELAGNLNPGETVTFNGLYPAPKTVGDREKCRRLEAGAYAANAVFLVCDGDAYQDGYCDISKDTQFKAHPVLIDVKA